MKCRYKITGFLLSFIIISVYLAHSPAYAEPTRQKTLGSVRDTDLSVSPFKGPAEAPVKIAVFSCFQ